MSGTGYNIRRTQAERVLQDVEGAAEREVPCLILSSLIVWSVV